MNRTILVTTPPRLVLLGVLLLAVAIAATGASATEGATGDIVERENSAIPSLEKAVEQLQEELRNAEKSAIAAGGSTDAELAERVLLQEDLLLTERTLFEAAREERRARSSEDAPVRRLQRRLADATTHRERVEILSAHRAVDRVLAAEESIQIRSTSRQPE